jgi:hypothetical protein
MGDLPELWSDRVVREFAGIKRLWKSNRWLAGVFLVGIAIYGWHQFGPPLGSLSSYALTDKNPPINRPNLSNGAAGWIYVGSRDGLGWKKFNADGIEPMLTLETNDLPTPGSAYRVVESVYLRDSLPTPQVGARPVMADSKGTILAGSQVKVDDIVQLQVPDPPRVWVWAHVTLTR